MRLSQPAGILLRQPIVSVGIQTGADPTVLTGSFNVQAYATSRGFGTIPAETGPTQEPIADQGAVGNGVADDTAAVQAALAALPGTGGVLDLSQGIFGIGGTGPILSVGSKQNITIKGGGWSDGVAQTSGLKVLNSTSPNRNDAAIRHDPPANDGLNLVVRDLEIDVNNTTLGGINTQSGTNCWIISCYVHDVGDGSADSPRAAIMGTDDNTNRRVIGNLVRRTSAAGTSAVRGIWSAEVQNRGCVIAHNIVSDTGHTGIILHTDTGPLNTIEYNSVFRPGLAVGGGGNKAEFNVIGDRATFDIPETVQIHRRNYVDVDFTNFNTNPSVWGMQSDTGNVEVRENIFVDTLRAHASFIMCRKVIIEDNVFQEISEYGIHTDVSIIAAGEDHTGLIFRNNTITADGKPMIHGINFGSQFVNCFQFNNPIEVVDNKIIGQSGSAVNTTTALDNYVNYTQSNNGPTAPGARNVLLPPIYA